MTCVVCGKQQRSNSRTQSDWRCLVIDSDRCYACPSEFPPDGSGKTAYQAAYEFVMACSLNEILKRNNQKPIAEVEQARLAVVASRQSKSRGFGGDRHAT